MLEQHVFLYDTFMKYGSARKCQQKHLHEIHNERAPSRQTVHNLANKLRKAEPLTDNKQKHMH
jgi:hypothetical protein